MIKKITKKDAELIGMHVGDGTLYKTSYSIVWELRGALDEKDYYINNVVPLLKHIFKIDFNAKFRSGGKNGCFGVQTSKKVVTDFFILHQFTPGRKTHTVRIPDYIKIAKPQIQFAFVRGLFDTDGCLRFERINNRMNHEYPRLEFGFASKNLRDDLFDLLTRLGYKAHIWGKETYKVGLCGKANLCKFMKEIAPRNKKHLNKYLFWREKGYKNPNARIA